MRCSTPQFSDHWLSLFPPTLSVPYENKKDERERLFAKIGRLEMELDWLKKIGLMAKYIRPYLLRGLLINRPNQVWAIDITYINSDQGSQSIIFIERFWRTIKYDYVYLHPMNDGRAM